MRQRPIGERALADLLAALPDARVLGSVDVAIEAISSDSRQIRPGSLFVAYRGVVVDGHDYVDMALENGAAALVLERQPRRMPPPVPAAIVPSGRKALAYLSAAWYGFPSRQLTVVGVTGTDGKTTTCNLLHRILSASGRRAGLVTTVNAVIGERIMDTGLHTTTPDAPEVQSYLAEMVHSGMEIAVLETTSHGLEQHRVTACDFDMAIVTNVTHEHLDIHGSLEAYQQAKARLFEHLAAGYRKPGILKTAILNADDDSYRYLSAIPADRRLVYSLKGGQENSDNTVSATAIHRTAGTTNFVVKTAGIEFELQTTLVGDYNLSNILAAASASLGLGVPIEFIQQGVWETKGIIGRMERLDEGQDFLALIDFAHTPNALQRALETAQTLAQGRVIAVFGCAGERDREKRAWMGRIAGHLADVSVHTAEDPRTESLDDILAEMARGAEEAGAVRGKGFFQVHDRAEAIRFAVDLAKPGDVVITCGKGHELSMCYGAVETPWSEHDALRKALIGRSAQAT